MKYTNTKGIKQQVKLYIDHRERDKNPLSKGGYSLSGLFKFIRTQPQFYSLGDYVILSSIIASVKGNMPQDLRRKLFYVMSHSDELSRLRKSEKQELVERLMEVAA